MNQNDLAVREKTIEEDIEEDTGTHTVDNGTFHVHCSTDILDKERKEINHTAYINTNWYSKFLRFCPKAVVIRSINKPHPF